MKPESPPGQQKPREKSPERKQEQQPIKKRTKLWITLSDDEYEEDKDFSNYYSNLEWREFTDQEKKEYNEKLEKSEGFDVGFVEDEIIDAPIKPVRCDRCNRSVLTCFEDCAKLALEKYNGNRKIETTYEFVDLVKANVGGRCCGGQLYYITFEATDVPGSAPKHFQARLKRNEDEYTVQLCRPEPKS